MHRQHTRAPGVAAAFCAIALLSFGCGSEDNDTKKITEASAGTGALSVRGAVKRSVDISQAGDGRGTVHISIADDCRNERGTGIKPLVSFKITDADLRDDDSALAFVIKGLEADHTYYAAAWFDDVDNEEQEEDLPAKGDLAMFGDLSPRCAKVELKKSDFDGLELVLDYEMMFTLPGLEGDSGVMMTDDDDDVDPGDIVDDGSKHTVTILLSRSVNPADNGDAKGKLYGGLSEDCFSDTTGEVPVPAFAVIKDGVSLPKINEPIELVVEDVPNGIYQFNAFIDDVANADAKNPRPGIGDLVSFGGFGPSCTKVVVNGEDVKAKFDLNLLMPFDL